MPKNANYTFVSPCTAEIYTAPVGTSLPTASTAIPAPFTSIGMWSEDPTLGLNVDSEDLRVPNSCAPVRTVVKAKDFSWQINQAQWTKMTVEHYFGAGTWATSGTGERWTPGTPGAVEKALIFQMVDGTRELRILCPRVGFLPNGDIDWSSESLVALPVKATVLAPASGAELFIDAVPVLAAA